MVFKIILFLALSEASLRCLYFWQLKEYRWDRFREFLKSGEARRYFLPGRHFLRPRLTAKIGLLFWLSLIIAWEFAWWLGYWLMPLIAAASVALVRPFSSLGKYLVVAAAKIKLVLYHRRLLVIGVTGSFGKTSTKEILAHLLSSRFRVAKTWDTNNTLIGVAKTVLFKLPVDTQVFVVEMGAYKIGEIASICRLVKPRIGILTGINQQHLGLFGSLENIVKAKSELLRALPTEGLAVVNGVNAFSRKLKAPKAVTRYYRAAKVKTNLLGFHQQLNIGAALAVAKYLGVKRFDLNIPSFKTAITQTRGLSGALIINDSYNSNPDGFLAAIRLAQTMAAKKKILISPGIIELGQESEAVHRRLLAAARPVFEHIFLAWPERRLLPQLKKILTKNHLLLIEGRFSKKFIDKLCLKDQS